MSDPSKPGERVKVEKLREILGVEDNAPVEAIEQAVDDIISRDNQGHRTKRKVDRQAIKFLANFLQKGEDEFEDVTIADVVFVRLLNYTKPNNRAVPGRTKAYILLQLLKMQSSWAQKALDRAAQSGHDGSQADVRVNIGIGPPRDSMHEEKPDEQGE